MGNEGSAPAVGGEVSSPNAIPSDVSTAVAAIGGASADKAPEGNWSLGDEDGGTEISEKAAPQPAKKPEEPTAAQKKEWKLKAKDKELVINDEKRLVELAQKGLHFDQEGHLVAKSRKEAEAAHHAALEKEQQFNQLVEALQEDPISALMHLYKGDKAKVRQVVEPWLGKEILQEIDDEQNPHQKAIREANARAEAAEKQLKAQAEMQQKAQQEAELKHWRDHHEKVIMEKLQAAHIPKTPRAIKAYADQLYRYAKLNIEPNHDAIAESIRGSYIEDTQFIGGAVASRINEAYAKQDIDTILAVGDQLPRIFGEDLIKAVRIYDLTKLKKQRQGFPQQIVPGGAPVTQQVPVEKKTGYLDMDEWRDQAKSRAAALQSGQAVPDWK